MLLCQEDCCPLVWLLLHTLLKLLDIGPLFWKVSPRHFCYVFIWNLKSIINQHLSLEVCYLGVKSEWCFKLFWRWAYSKQCDLLSIFTAILLKSAQNEMVPPQILIWRRGVCGLKIIWIKYTQSYIRLHENHLFDFFVVSYPKMNIDLFNHLLIFWHSCSARARLGFRYLSLQTWLSFTIKLLSSQA